MKRRVTHVWTWLETNSIREAKWDSNRDGRSESKFFVQYFTNSVCNESYRRCKVMVF